MVKEYTTLLIDMYGVILNEPKGRVLDYARDILSSDEYKRVESTIWSERLFDKAGLGEIDSNEFFKRIGLDDTEYHMKQYLDKYLTLDSGFTDFAEKVKDRYELVLLSNDVSEWSSFITRKFGLDKYFSHKIISADVKCRKPELRMYDLTLDKIGRSAYECIFIDNTVENLLGAEEVGISPVLFNRDGSHYYGASVCTFDELGSLIG